jgi:hypothetical protein
MEALGLNNGLGDLEMALGACSSLKVNENVNPLPFWLSTWMLPSINSTRFFDM